MAFDKTGFATIGASKKGTARFYLFLSNSGHYHDCKHRRIFQRSVDTLAVGDLIYCVTSFGGTRVVLFSNSIQMLTALLMLQMEPLARS